MTPNAAPLALVALLSASAAAPADPPRHGVTAGHVCDASKLRHFIGEVGTIETAAMIKRLSHSAVLRWATPGVMLTMDYRSDRVNVGLGPDRKITSIKCG